MNDNMNTRQPISPNVQTGVSKDIVVMPRPAPAAQKPNGGRQMLAIAFVPTQKWEDLYEPEVAFDRGTIFQALDLPFLGSEGVNRG